MNLYLITQDQNHGYDTYDSAVVVAPDEETARRINPNSNNPKGCLMTDDDWGRPYSCWCNSPERVSVHLVGKAKDGQPLGVVLASFNAG